jgi:hypothetical protein
MAKNLIKLFQDFSQSVDIVDDKQLDSIKSIFDKIVESLDIEFYEVQKAQYTKKGNVQLSPYWCNKKKSEPSNLTKDKNGGYRGEEGGQVAYAFTNNKSLWITNKGGSPLSSEQSYIDSWPEGEVKIKEAIPEFWPANEKNGNIKKKVKTSIIILLKYSDGNIPIGIINFESSKPIVFTPEKQSWFDDIATSVATIMQLHSINKIQNDNTKFISKKILDADSLPLLNLLDKPKVFVAFPNNCEEDIILAIKEWRDKHKESLRVIFWDDISKSGDILYHIIEEIKTSKYGIAYFSEKLETEIKIKGQAKKYIYNHNVLFEAGMFYAIVHDEDEDTLMKEWVPIRENDKLCLSKTPFDLNHEQMITVKRNNDGEFDKNAFILKLNEMTKAWE